MAQPAGRSQTGTMCAWDGIHPAKGFPMSDLSAVPFRTVQIDGAPAHAFGGFPYLLTQVAEELHHIILLPPDPSEQLVQYALAQWQSNGLPTCLCLDWDEAIYVRSRGALQVTTRLPYSTFAAAFSILPEREIPHLPESDARVEQLRFFTRGLEAWRMLRESEFAQPLKGGWEGPADERALLLTSCEGGEPYGLVECPVCGEFRGSCLDPSFEFRGISVAVTCQCLNDTCCGACGQPLDEHRLNSNFYDRNLNQVINVPAYRALLHRCFDDAQDE